MITDCFNTSFKGSAIRYPFTVINIGTTKRITYGFSSCSWSFKKEWYAQVTPPTVICFYLRTTSLVISVIFYLLKGCLNERNYFFPWLTVGITIRTVKIFLLFNEWSSVIFKLLRNNWILGIRKEFVYLCGSVRGIIRALITLDPVCPWKFIRI